MNEETLDIQASVLRLAADDSPMAAIAGMLMARGDELARTAKAWRDALNEEIDEKRLELLPALALEVGCTIYWPNIGCGRVLRVARDGGGIYVDFDNDVPSWVNPLVGGSPVVVVAPLRRQPRGLPAPQQG